MVQRSITNKAREHRRNGTASEDRFWEMIKFGRLSGFKFRRQHPLDRFILDFYCAEKSLAVEIDGSVHDGADAQARDEERERWLGEKGVRIVRFSNDDVTLRISQVKARLLAELTSPTPLQDGIPHGGPPRSGGLVGAADRGANMRGAKP